MKIKVVPGFKSLFGESKITYEELLKEVPTDIVIRLLISLNAELNTKEKHLERQARLRRAVSFRFSINQIALLDSAFKKYESIALDYDGTLFGRRYLLHMILKEFKRNKKCNIGENEPQQEFNFLMAYLMCIDEVHDINNKIVQELQVAPQDEISQIKIIWKGMLNQYEFNESANGAFELYRLVCFFKYGIDCLRPYIRELLNRNGFRNLSELLGSFSQLLSATINIDETQLLKKLYFIVPNKNFDNEHLTSLSINRLMGDSNIGLAEIKKFPLYKTDDRGFMIVDESMLTKKIYKGPLFETFYSTRLKQETEGKISNPKNAFGNYKTRVSKEALEKLCFQGIIKSAKRKKEDVLHFDENLSGLPDMYFRSGKKIIMIEFKDNLFPDNIAHTNDSDSLLQFIEERFIENKSGTKKGIGQLINNLEHIYQGHFSFDPGLKKLLDTHRKLDICCIICYTDFMIGMPGINEYLNIRFSQEIDKSDCRRNVENITLLNLQTLFHYIVSGRSLMELKSLIERYWSIIANRKSSFKKIPNSNNFLAAKASFEEVYDSLFLKEQVNEKEYRQRIKMSEILAGIGMNDGLLNEII